MSSQIPELTRDSISGYLQGCLGLCRWRTGWIDCIRRSSRVSRRRSLRLCWRGRCIARGVLRRKMATHPCSVYNPILYLDLLTVSLCMRLRLSLCVRDNTRLLALMLQLRLRRHILRHTRGCIGAGHRRRYALLLRYIHLLTTNLGNSLNLGNDSARRPLDLNSIRLLLLLLLLLKGLCLLLLLLLLQVNVNLIECYQPKA